jgi:hypothetical protein
MNPVTTTHAINIHAEAMLRTADSYDSIKEVSRQTISSLSPGPWLTETCVAGGGWAVPTESTESALAIAESYAFRSRSRLLRYPAEGPRNKDDDQVFVSFWSWETRSLVHKRCQRPGDHVGCIFTGSRVSDKGYASQPQPRERLTGGDKKSQSSAPTYRYQLISDAELNSAYADYMLGITTKDSVIETVKDYVQRKVELGTNEYKLRERGAADDITGDFLWSIHRALGNESIEEFANYVKVAWARRRSSVYRELKGDDALFSSSTFSTKDKLNDDGAVIKRAVSHEDKYAVALCKHPQIDDAADALVLAGEFMSQLKDAELEVAKEMMAGLS